MRSNTVDEWFLNERGITKETLDYFGVRETDDAVVYTYPTGEKYRKLQDGVPSRLFYSPKGLQLSLYSADKHAGNFRGEGKIKDVAFICEGETDTMRLQQELGWDSLVYGISGVNGWKTDFANEFSEAGTVFVCLDNDSDYTVASTVDQVWNSIRSDLKHGMAGRTKARRIVLPYGIKDICEFFKSYGLDELRKLVSTRTYLYDNLNLLGTPPEVNWLVSNLIASGDINLLMGDPGLGKSWLGMSLAVSIAEGHDTWLDHTIDSPGRVLYIDEENAEDVIYDRFAKLGLTSNGADNIRFLFMQGIKLDKSPERLYEEAELFDPSLVIIDSLSQVHSLDENSSSDMSKLFKQGIMPLARDLGAAVILIHHSNKVDTASGYKRSRGSGAITASVDAAFDVRPANPSGSFVLSTYKSRRRPARESILISVVDGADGRVRLINKDQNGGF